MCDFEILPMERSEAEAPAERGVEQPGEEARDGLADKSVEQAAEKEAVQRLDDATVEPRGFVEVNNDYKQAEDIQRDFAAVADSFAERETNSTSEQVASLPMRLPEPAADVGGPGDQTYGIDETADGRTTVTFGDGETGDRPTTESGAPSGDYRDGGGAAGDAVSEDEEGGAQANAAMGIGGDLISEDEEGGAQANTAMGLGGGLISEDEEGGAQANAAMGIGGDLIAEDEEGGPQANAAMGLGGDLISEDEEGGPQATSAMGLGGDLISEDEEGGAQANAAMGIGGDLISEDEEGGSQANAAMGLGANLVSDDEEGGPQANTANGLGDGLPAGGLTTDEVAKAVAQQALEEQLRKSGAR